MQSKEQFKTPLRHPKPIGHNRSIEAHSIHELWSRVLNTEWFAKTRESHLSVLHFTTLFVHILLRVFVVLHVITP